MRTALNYFVLAGLIGLIGWKLSGFFHDPTILPPDDFVEYWAAGKLNFHGQNPYDPVGLYPLERFEAGRTDIDEFGDTVEVRAVMMWNPPWTLSIAMPLGLLPPRLCQLLWMAVNFLIVGFCTLSLWRLYGGESQRWWLSLAMAFLYMPTVYCLSSGQISSWILLGITLFLLCIQRDWFYLAGAAGVLMAIKPHLVYLFWLALFGWSFFDRRGWKIIAGGTIAGILCTAGPLLCNSQVLSQYWEAMHNRPPEHFQSPTLGTLLRKLEGYESFKFQFVPMLLGLAGLMAIVWLGRKQPWTWRERMPLVVLASFVTAAYGAWPYDLLILLPLIIDIAARISREPSKRHICIGVLAYVSFNIPMLVLTAFKVNSFWFFWAAPVIAVEYLILRKKL